MGDEHFIWILIFWRGEDLKGAIFLYMETREICNTLLYEAWLQTPNKNVVIFLFSIVVITA